MFSATRWTKRSRPWPVNQTVIFTRSIETEDARAALRIRLAALALGTTLLVLVPSADRGTGAIVLVLYAVAACLVRLGAGRPSGRALADAAIVMDLAYATAMISVLPIDAPSWALYAFAIGGCTLARGSWGAVASTAGAIVAYDIALGMRAAEATAAELWPIQVLIAIGLLVAELVYLAARLRDERRGLRALAVAQRDVAAADSIESLRARVASHAVASFGASRAEVVPAGTDTRWANVRLPIGSRGLVLAARFDPPSGPQVALAVDLVNDAASVHAALAERDDGRAAAEVAARLRGALERIWMETDRVSLLAELGMSTAGLGGPSSVVRMHDGAVVAGERLSSAVTTLLRDTRAPCVLRGPEVEAVLGGQGRVLAVAPAGAGHVLARGFTDAAPTEMELNALALVGATAGAILARIDERDELSSRLGEVRDLADGMRSQLRDREDLLRTTVHELRTPITSVTAYGQLIARNLQAALQQVAQLDRLIGDLRGGAAPGASLALTDTDLLREAKDAAQRQRILHDAIVTVEAVGATEFPIRADRGRLAQVLDNLLDNAVKYSPKKTPIQVTVRRDGDEVQVDVRDNGIGMSGDDIEHVFERYYRSDTALRTTTGTGIGLALSRDIVLAHEGRIHARSEGEGKGSTFTFTLPLAKPSQTSRD